MFEKNAPQKWWNDVIFEWLLVGMAWHGLSLVKNKKTPCDAFLLWKSQLSRTRPRLPIWDQFRHDFTRGCGLDSCFKLDIWGPNRAMPPKNSFDGQTYPVDRYRPVDFAGYPGTLFSDYPICRYLRHRGGWWAVSTCFPHPITSFFLGVICAWVKITHHPFGTSRGPSGWFDVYTPSMTTFVGPLAIATPISTHESHLKKCNVRT